MAEGTNQNLDDLEILEDLKKMIYEAIKNKKSQPKVGDLLKVIELKRKLAVSGKAEKKFWDMINSIRKDELSKPAKTSVRKKRSSGKAA
jgi:hypothetical protein